MGIKVRIEVTNDADSARFTATTLVELSAEGNKLSTLGTLLGHAVNGAVAGLSEDKKGLHGPMGQALCEGLDDDFLADDSADDGDDDEEEAFFPNANYPTVGVLMQALRRFKPRDRIRLSLDVSQNGDTPEEAGKRVFGEVIHEVLQSHMNECTLIARGDFNYDPTNGGSTRD
jgi:hypothetical protein